MLSMECMQNKHYIIRPTVNSFLSTWKPFNNEMQALLWAIGDISQSIERRNAANLYNFYSLLSVERQLPRWPDLL